MPSSIECVWKNGTLVAKGGEDLKDWLLAQIIETPSHINNFRISFESVIDEEQRPQYTPAEILEVEIKSLEQRIVALRNTLTTIKTMIDKTSVSSNPMDYVYAHQQVFVEATNALQEDEKKIHD